MIIASFIFFLLVFVAIGTASVKLSKKTSDDYLVASRSLPPWLVALSAVATNNSGFMFVGLIGMTYTMGLSASWLMIGWIFGDLLVSFFFHKRLREASGKHQATSYNQMLAVWSGHEARMIRKIAAVITLLFLGTYAAAQLNAGSKALHVLFGWDYSVGAIIGAVMVLLYCFAGGIRASVWTDAAQSFVMIVAMSLLIAVSFMQVGGPDAVIAQLNEVDPALTQIFPDTKFGPLLFIAGWFAAGVGVIGQPHIMIRFMALEHADKMNRVRAYYYSWYIVFSIMAILVGLAARLLLPDVASFDPELALPSLALEFLSPVLVGLILAGLFAATMSTADSQILSCSAALTHDLLPVNEKQTRNNKLATIGCTALILVIALAGPDSVFTLVTVAWSVLAVAFGPVMLGYALGSRPSQWRVLGTMGLGLAALFIWRHMGLSEAVFEVFPGMIAGGLAFLILKPVDRFQTAQAR